MTLDSLYAAPLMLEESHFSGVVCRELHIDAPDPDLTEWENMTRMIENPENEVTIALVGKYTQLHDAYLSVAEALRHAGFSLKAKVNIRWTDSEDINESNYKEVLKDVSGVIVPGGFGDRGIEGMILSARYCRENNIPYFGICLGMQIAERHRHRYEFNNDYREVLQNAGLCLSGMSPDGQLVETVELANHSFFLGVQYHPKFKSRPNKPHPVFLRFVEVSLKESGNHGV